MVKAVVFDMDGVIIDSEQIHVKAEKQVLLKYGVKITSSELQKYAGVMTKSMFSELVEKYKLDVTPEKISREKEEIFFELLKEDLRPTVGVIELIKKLKQEKFKLAVASSSHKRLIGYVLEKLKIANLFDYIAGSDDVEHGKPNPEIFLKTATKLGLNPSECLVIEDSEAGIEAAKKAGMKCIGYRNPSSGTQDLSKADLIIDDFSKLSLQKILSL